MGIEKSLTDALTLNNSVDDRLEADYVDRKRPRILGRILKSYDELFVHAHAHGAALDVPKNAPILFVSTHESHLDYGLISLVLSDPAVMALYPRIIAGTNLLGERFSKFVRFFTGADFPRLGAIPIERTKNGAEKAKSDVIQLLRQYKPVAVFPETWTFPGQKTPKVGRSYDGTRGKFSRYLVSGLTDLVKETGQNGFLIPITISYDFVSEDRLFPQLLQRLLEGNSQQNKTGLSGDKMYELKEKYFFLNPYKYGLGDIYFDIGEPIQITPDSHSKKVVALANDACMNMHRVSGVSIISECVVESMDSMTLDKLFALYSQRIMDYNNAGSIFVRKAFGYENFLTNLHRMDQRGLISVSHRANSIQVLNQPVINYYANMLKHFKIDQKSK